MDQTNSGPDPALDYQAVRVGSKRRKVEKRRSTVKRKPSPSRESLKSGRSKDNLIDFYRAGSGPSCVSLKSDRSKNVIIDFYRGSEIFGPAQSMQSDSSKSRPIDFKGAALVDKGEEPGPERFRGDPHLRHIFMELEENILAFVKEQLSRFYLLLASEYPESLEHEEEGKSKEAVLNITVDFMKRMKQEALAERLYNLCPRVYRHELKKILQQKFSCVSEGIAKAGEFTLLKQIYTDLHITEGGAAEVNQEHEVRHIESASRKSTATETTVKCEDLFKHPKHGPIREEMTQRQGPIREERTQRHGPIKEKRAQRYGPIREKRVQRHGPIRTVLTKGVAGVGKTILTQKFTLDWAENRAHQDVLLLFPFTFRELNVLRDKQLSLVGLIQHFFSQFKGLCTLNERVLFILDGLDECRLPLDFSGTRVLTDPTECVSLEVLLVNLIRGDLLPSVHLWITTRPAAASQIPAECVSMVTEVRGFTDPQKEEYFRKKFRDEQQTSAVISHIKKSRSLFIMCHLPIFSWMVTTVLDHVMETGVQEQLPHTMTELYIHFLVVQVKVKSVKYDGRSETDLHWSSETKKMLQSLGKLAFEQLQKGNLIFYESDLSECGLDAAEMARYAGVFTQVFREEPGLYQDKVYCFIHLSVQEFLAALHVHLAFFNFGVNLLPESQRRSGAASKEHSPKKFYRSAVDQALNSPNGHLDLFLRFLLGLSLSTNQMLLSDLLTPKLTSRSPTNEDTAKYIKKRLDHNVRLSAERRMNLLHCLNELNDHSLVEQVQQSVREGRFAGKLMSHSEWSAVAFLVLSSDSDLEDFDLRRFHPSIDALLGLLPLVKASTRATLSQCRLTYDSCDFLVPVLSSSTLTHLDLSLNNLRDSGVKILCEGLKSAPCRLLSLSLSDCKLSNRCCEDLACVLSSSSLTHLDLSNNQLMDSGVEQLCVGLKSAPCRLEVLSLSACMASERGGAYLASVLASAHSSLKELDLSYNHPGGSAELLTSVRDDPLCSLHSLRLDPSGKRWMVPGPRKYFCEVTLDPNTANNNLKLSEDKRSVSAVSEPQLSPRHEDGPRGRGRVLSAAPVTGRCYWEVQRSGHVDIAVRALPNSEPCEFGDDDQSWSLRLRGDACSVCHCQREIDVKYYVSDRVAVLLDTEAGALSFYTVHSDGDLWHLHTFSCSFTEPVFVGFGLSPGSSVTLLRVPEGPDV